MRRCGLLLAALLQLSGRVHAAYPGPEWLHPKLHYSPDCLHDNGWHDIAGALTWQGRHHVFQGCPNSGGWHHGSSADLVHWTDMGQSGPQAIHESHAGMSSFSSPCSGFVTVDDENGKVCAGFRQCGSDKGVVGGKSWDVPLELRCAQDANLTSWGDPEYLFDVFFWRALPYDPARPWRDNDGNWYTVLSTDGCNGTKGEAGVTCPAGGRLDMWRSPALRGERAAWEHTGHIFTTNRTVCDVPLTSEFVTIDFIGGIPGDAKGGTRVLFNNFFDCCSGTTGYYIGTQSNGGPFTVDWSNPATVGMVDWGAFSPTRNGSGVAALTGHGSRGFSMARTLGGAPNQVTEAGRRVMVGWAGETPASLSLARDLVLDSQTGELLQLFVPELAVLRKGPATAGQQLEIRATLTHQSGPYGVDVLMCNGTAERTRIGIDPVRGLAFIDGTTQGNKAMRAGPFSKPLGAAVQMHAYVDHSIVEVIFDSRIAVTAYVSPSSADCGGVSHFGSGPWPMLNVYALSDANNV
eukprot:TRINITY_DN21795_c0_g1_i1.p1 TRINITY_DN21795_c0_g1~~TRINITY_DN21795_c0_g1_i1.p1  ORF type:complete len:548 (+),score=109.37 TRINITY_DN21795_c0_g1_i1:85-1644(+)